METSNTLHDVLSMAISHIEVIRKQLIDLNLTADDKEDSEKHKRAAFLMAACSAIIDIMHPAMHEAYKIFPEKVHPLLDYYKQIHAKHPARDGSVQCPCRACNKQTENDDSKSTSGNTDQAQ